MKAIIAFILLSLILGCGSDSKSKTVVEDIKKIDSWKLESIDTGTEKMGFLWYKFTVSTTSADIEIFVILDDGTETEIMANRENLYKTTQPERGLNIIARQKELEERIKIGLDY